MYEFKSEPLSHQAAIFDATRDLEAYGLLWEQGCGKSKPTIDTAAHLYESGKINTLLVVAPSGVERNWITDELPKHLPDRVMRRTRGLYYEGKRKKSKAYNVDLQEALAWKGLLVLAISYDSFITEHAKEYLGKLMRARKCLLVPDESQFIKNPEAIRTRTLEGAKKLAPYRRILSGTPVVQGPFDIYSQIKFLDDGFWKRKGLASYSAFKKHFGEFSLKPFGPGGRKIEVLDRYKNLEQLAEWIREITDRKTKLEVLDLPPKIYQKRYVELSPEQERLYSELKQYLMTQMAGGQIIEAPLAIVQALRFQQIVCGYATDIEGNVIRLTGDNPRLSVLGDVVEDATKPGIIWARFTEDINQICDLLKKRGKSFVRYDGQISDDQRAKNKLAFQEDDVQWFVGNPAVGARGLTLLRAKLVVYYSNSFRLEYRLQSEDRPHRLGQDEPVTYIDLVTPGTIDDRLVSGLREKKDIASLINGDTITEWI